jgi:N-acetylglutamate synthase
MRRMPPTPDPIVVWSTLGRHGRVLYGRAGGFQADGPGWFAILTGEPNADLNITGLFGPAGALEADRVLDAADAVGGPLAVVVSPTLTEFDVARLLARGLLAITQPEALMWRPSSELPPPAVRSFRIVRVRSTADLHAAAEVMQAAHGIEPEQVDRIFDLGALEDGRVGCWVAWDGDDPASTGWLTLEGPLVGVWEMMTAPAHRRRGAARAVLTSAMAEAAGQASDGFFLWASPMGRPLYSSLGFVPIDEVTVWVRGVDLADLERIGALPPG